MKPITLLYWLESLSSFEQIALAVAAGGILAWIAYEAARLVGTAQSGDIDWNKYE